MLKWTIRIFLALLTVIALALVAGMIYERRAQARVLAQFPPVGKLVDIGGRRIHLDCRGTGTPIVIFEAGRDLNGSLSWYLVHDDVAAFTRACAYSRAGIMWSDPKSARPTSRGAANDLHAALRNAGEKGPFVLVGHSAGGLAILVYTKYYPTEVGGLVFVDASHPETFERLTKPGMGITRPSIEPLRKVARAFAWAGTIRLLFPPSPVTNGPEAMKIASAFTPYSWVGATLEIDEDDDWFSEAGTVHSLGSRPTLVLSGMKYIPQRLNLTPEQEKKRLEVWHDMQSELAALSTVSRHEEDMEADHYVQTSNPSHVVSAVKWVVEKVRETPPP